MKFDIDACREIIDTITRNKSRSILTGFGVFWGIFMLIVLIGGAAATEFRRLCHKYGRDMVAAYYQTV